MMEGALVSATGRKQFIINRSRFESQFEDCLVTEIIYLSIKYAIFQSADYRISPQIVSSLGYLNIGNPNI